MKYLLYHFALVTAGVWAIGHFFNPGMNKPLVFITIFTGVCVAIWLSTYFYNRRYFYKFILLIQYILYIIKELFIANFRVAYDVITPVHHMNPAIVAIPLEAKSDREIVTLAILITFTPGTLSIDISDDRKTLYVHEMYIPDNDVEAVKKKIKDGFEKKLLALTR